MHPPLTTATQTAPTDLPRTWIGLRTALAEAHQAADVLGAADPSVTDVPALCAHAVDALAWARPAEPDPAASRTGASGHRSPGSATSNVPTDEELAEVIAESLALAVEVLDNDDEPLTTAEVMAISQAVAALCNARAALEGANR